MLAQINNYFLLKEIKSSPKILKQFTDWENINSIVILVSMENRNLISDFIKAVDKKIEIIILQSESNAVFKDCYISINSKDFNFFDLPKTEIMKKIKAKPFDVLINFDFKDDNRMKVLTGLIPAKCKLGPKGSVYSSYFDICVQSSINEYLGNAHKYLMMIKS